MTAGPEHSPPGPSVLPEGRQLAVTWGIPDRFGGMTSALLHRSRAFVHLGGREVDIVTFDTRPDYDAVRERLTESGELARGIRLRNLYEDLRAAPPPPAPLVHRVGDPRVDDVAVTTAPDGSELRVGLRGGRRMLLEHRRADGTIAVRDERLRPTGPRRLITAYDGGGAPVHQWTSAWDCYADWLDGVIGTDAAYAITDSKAIAPFMAQYRRPNVVSMHVVHGSHLAGAHRPYGLLRPSRRPVFVHLERFDAVVLLTVRQRDDVVTLLSDPGNLAIVPNGIDLPGSETAASETAASETAARASTHDDDRDPAAGVVVAGLTPRKRVGHAIDVVARCRAGGMPVTLTVYGDGPDAATLHARVVDAGLDDVVGFAGHRRDAADAFGAASWTLLTSTSEGAPLVLAEAMARGCLPIAYDIPYGPSDLIVDGVNGFLVPAGDRSAAAAAIARLVGLPPEARAAMRRAARETADRHDDRRIVAEWGRVERAAARRRHDREQPPLEASVTRYRLRFLRGRLLVTARLAGVPPGSGVTVTLRQRGRGALLRTRLRAGRRVRLRLGERETDFLGGRQPLLGEILIERGESRVEVDFAAVHPDTRSLARRVVRRIARRITGRGET